MAKFCSNCGYELQESDTVCAECESPVIYHPVWSHTPNRFTSAQVHAAAPQRLGGPTQRSGPVGVPAITPYLNPDNPELPTFTAADASAYVLNNPPMGFQKITGESVTSVEFMTSGQANTMLNTNIMLPATKVVCVVELSGTFQLPPAPSANIPGTHLPITGGPQYTFSTVYEVFDGITGNLMNIHAPVSALIGK